MLKERFVFNPGNYKQNKINKIERKSQGWHISEVDRSMEIVYFFFFDKNL